MQKTLQLAILTFFFFFFIKLITEQTEGKILAEIFVSYSNMIVLRLTEIDCRDFFLLVTALLAKFGDVG